MPATDGADGPFRTLTRARDAVRQRRSARPDEPVTVALQAGLYLLDDGLVLESCDSGSPQAPVVYQGQPGAEVILAGAQRLPADRFTEVTDAAVRNRLDPSVRAHVCQLDLHALGIDRLDAFPDRFQGFPKSPELFFNHCRMTLARWPNEGWSTISQFIDSGSWEAPPGCPTTGRGGVFTCPDDRPARWNVADGVWLHGYWAFDWSDEVVRVQAIDAREHRITLAAPTQFGVKPRNPAPRRWCAWNLLEELDQPGEYYIDRRTLRLYFWPPEPLHEDACILLSRLQTPVVTLRDVSHVVLRGLTIEAALSHGIEVIGDSQVHIEACTVRNVRELGVRIEGGAGHRVAGCDVYDTGTGGLRMGGGDRRSLTPAGHEAINNHIHHFSAHRQTSAYAIVLAGVGNRAAHNLIHDAPHQAVCLQGNDHIVELNEIHHVCQSTDDCGALYKGRNPSCRGNVIRFNHWHDIGSPRGHGNGAIYFDDGDGGDVVFGNLFVRCCEPGKARWGAVYSHGGHDLQAQNNVFINCRRALGSGPWSDERWSKAISGADGHQWPRLLREEVDITTPPYSTRYPDLAGLLDLPPSRPRTSRAISNLIVDCDDIASGNWIVDSQQNWITTRNPGFVDAAHGNYVLTANAEVLWRLPGFVPLPLAQMGLLDPRAPKSQVGVTISHLPAAGRAYVGSPALAVLPDGRYVASHDHFGPATREHQQALTTVFRSDDRGRSWTKIADVPGQFWSSLFVHRGALYLLGTDRHYGNAVIRRSTDGGQTWTTPSDARSGLLRDDGQYHCAPMPVLEHDGRLWRAMEHRDPPQGWGIHFRAGMMSVPVDADLLDACNWTFSNFLPSDRQWLGGTCGGWLEGNAVVARDGRVLDVLRVESGYPEKAAIVTVSPDGRTVSFDPQTGFIDFPGGAKKFTLRHDAASDRYWSLSTIVLEHDQPRNRPTKIRNTLALTSSADLRTWTIDRILLHHPDIVCHGFQYVDWLFDGEDIIAVCRTAHDDGLGGAHNQHDANFMTFHRVEGFRRRADDAAG